MNAMILAAGLGTRLGELGASMPKVLIDISGATLLARHVAYLEDIGVERVVVNVHHHAERIEEYVRSLETPLDVVTVHEPRLLGTAGGVRNALSLLGSGPFLVIYGDVLFPDPVPGMVERHLAGPARATLAVHEAESAIGKGVVTVEADRKVSGFIEKGAAGDAPALINSGLYVLEHDVVASLPAGTFCDFGQDVFPGLLASGAIIDSYRLPRPVIDIGTPEGLDLARRISPRLQGSPPS